MDSYLTEIKQLRIPRPKYEPNGSPPNNNAWHRFARPYTPPQDYHVAASEAASGVTVHRRKDSSGSEEFRPMLHEKF